MCGEAAWALRWSRLSHFSITTKVSAPYLAPGPPSASAAGPYSMQPASACTAGMLARKEAMIAGGYRDGAARHEIRHFPRAVSSARREPDAGDGARHGADRMARLARL